MKSFSQFAEEAKKDYFRLNPGDKSIENSILRNYNKKQKKYASSNLSPDAQDFLDDVSKKNKIGPNTVQDFKNKLDAIKRGENPDAASTQLSGKTKEEVFRDAQSNRTADEGKFKSNKNTTNNTVKTNNKVTQSKIDLKPNQKQLTNTDLDTINKPSQTTNKTSRRTPRRIEKTIKPVNYTTQGKGPFATMQRGLERTGLLPTTPSKELKSGKVTKITKTDLKNPKVRTNILKNTPRSLRALRILGGLGRIAGGAYAVKDFMDTAKKEKALGRGKTAARLAGVSRALGGYIGGGVGALAGGLAGGGFGSAVTGVAGGIAGYNVGTKVGDQIYKTGRDLVTGKKTFKQLRKDINKGAGNLYKGVKTIPGKVDKYLDPSQR